MKNPTVRCLTCVVGAWIASYGMVSSFPALAALPPPASVTIEAYHGTDLAAYTPAPISLESWGGEFIFDDQGSLDLDAPALIGLERSQTIASIDSLAFQRVAVTDDVSTLYSTFLVEPRFLRYCRLLN